MTNKNIQEQVEEEKIIIPLKEIEKIEYSISIDCNDFNEESEQNENESKDDIESKIKNLI